MDKESAIARSKEEITELSQLSINRRRSISMDRYRLRLPVFILMLFALHFIYLTSYSSAAVEQAKVGSSQNSIDIRSMPQALQAAFSAAAGHDDPAYAISRTGEGYHGSNAGHTLSMFFSSNGVTISSGKSQWGLRLNKVGYGNDMQAVASVAPKVTANRVDYLYSGMKEWYVNGPLGLEQGFTIYLAPSDKKDRGPLTLELSLSGNLSPALEGAGTGLVLTGHNGTQILRCSGLSAVDASGRQLHTWLELDGLKLLVRVDDAEAQYPVVVDPLIERQKLTASDGAAQSGFGIVALSGDGTTALIGSPGKTFGANTYQGAVYVFTLSGNTWSQQAELTLPDGANMEEFGVGVALSADGNTSLINTNQNNAPGVVHVFTRSGATWSQQQELTAPDGTPNDYFHGAALSADGSIALFSATGKNNGTGAAYVYTCGGGSCLLQQELMASDGAVGDHFGGGVLSGDGSIALIRGGSQDGPGAVYVFTRSGNAWSQQQKLTASDGVNGDGFGISALSTDGSTALMTSGAKTIGTNYYQGAAYVFTLSGNTWSQQQELTASDGAKNDIFGDGALSADGNTALVNAVGHKVGANTQQGTTYVFKRTGTTWSQQQELTASDGAAYSYFGQEAALSGDGSVALISAIGYNNNQGAVYVFGKVDYSANIVSAANIDGVSDTFTIWMDLKQNGDPASNKCSKVLKVADTVGRTAIQQSCVFLDGGRGRHKVTLEITKGYQPNSRARYIENASFYLCTSSGDNVLDPEKCSRISDTPKDFSVYGTTFDIGTHAWQFKNNAWANTPGQPTGINIGNLSHWLSINNNFFYAASVMQPYLKLGDIGNFWENIGYNSSNVGNFGAQPFFRNYLQEGNGQCYGLATSAIADYTHQDDPQAWGIAVFTQASWNTAIVGRSTDTTKTTSPFGVLAPGADIFTAPSLNDPVTLWTIDSAKKIMYHFVAQPSYKGGLNWVGQDISTGLNANTEATLINILKNGAPAKIGFRIVNVGGHAVMTPQLIIWNGHRQFMIWDNNWPLGTTHYSSPYTGIYFDNTAEYELYIPYIEIEPTAGSRKASLGWSLYNLNFLSPGCGDSQNIYNQWTGPCALSQLANAPADATDVVDYPYPDHIQVLVIGGQVTSVYDQTTSSPVALIPNGDLVAGQAVKIVSGNGLFTQLYLPISDTYQIQATKYAGFAGLKVFVTIPNTDGTVQHLNYDNLSTGEADATQITFTVRRGNTNTGISRTIANDTYNPDFNASLATELTPPTNLNAIINNTGTGVALSWTNTGNPSLASVLVIRKVGSAPSSSIDGVTVFHAMGQSIADTVTVNAVYYYAAYSMDGVGNLSAPTITKVNSGLRSVYGTITLTTGGVLSNASVQLMDSSSNVIDSTTSASDGAYALSNIASGSYTVTASHPTAVITTPSVAVTMIDSSQQVDFSATNKQTLFLLFDALSVTVGHDLSIPWTYRNIGNNETVNVSLLRNSVWETIASGVPILDGTTSWTVTGPDVSTATLRISQASNPSIFAEYTFSIAPSYNFLGTPTSGPAPLAVSFIDESTGSTAWLWNFGDGTTSTLQHPLHMYTNSGTYTVSLTATGTGGPVMTTKSNYISVSGTCNELPVMIAGTNAYFSFIQSALSVVGNDETLRIQRTSLPESPNTTQDVSFRLSGGYSCDHSMNLGFTTVNGMLTISHGTVTIENLIIQ